MTFFKAIKKGLLLMSLTLGVIGYFLIIKGQAFILVALDVLAYVLVGVGIIEIIRYQFLKIDERYKRNDFVLGLAIIAVGVVLYFAKNEIGMIAEYILGGFIIVSAVLKLQDYFDTRKLGRGSFGLYFTMLIICVAFAAIIFLKPFVGEMLYLVLGVGLMFSAVSDLFSNIYLAALKYGKERKELKEAKALDDMKELEKEKADALIKELEEDKNKKTQDNEENEQSHMTRIDL